MRPAEKSAAGWMRVAGSMLIRRDRLRAGRISAADGASRLSMAKEGGGGGGGGGGVGGDGQDGALRKALDSYHPSLTRHRKTGDRLL